MEQNKVTYKDIFKESEYRKLLLAGIINRFGDSVDAIAFTWLVYQITHSAAWSAIVFALNTLPNVLVQPFAGAIVEKMDKKAVIITTNLLRAAVVIVFAVMYRFGMLNAFAMAAMTLIITTIESFDLPADSAFTAQVIKKEHLTTGISLSKMLTGAATLVGTGVAGIIIAAFGVVPAMLIDVSTFLLAAVLISMMKHKEVTLINEGTEVAESGSEENSETKRDSVENFLMLFKDGVTYMLKTPVVRNFCLLCVALNFMLVPINALQAPIASEIFGMGGELLSFAGAFASIGGIVGAALLPVLSNRLSPLKITCLGIFALGIGLAGIAFGGIFRGNAIASYAVVSACFFAMTVAAALVGGVIGIQFMKSVEMEYMARASAVFGAVATASMPIGSILVSALVARISTDKILLVSAGFAGIIFFITAITRPDLEKQEELADAT